jgi:hypothetical protein
VQVKPKWRNGAGMAMILLLIVIWSAIVVSVAPFVTGLHWTVEALFYIVAGIAWIFPVRPLLSWMGK